MASPDAAAVKRHWSSAVKSLKVLTAAAADSSATEQQLQEWAAAAEAECSQALQRTVPQAASARQQGSIPEATRGTLVEDLKVPESLAEAISTLLATHSTSHAAAALSQQLSTLLAAQEPALPLLRPPEQTARRRQQPGNGRTIAKQLSASGLMQQLPAALQQAQQQLQKLQPGGTSSRAANSTDDAAPAAVHLQAGLLALCGQLISFWPKGALESAALGPSLVPAAELALASLQYACKHTSQHSSSSSSAPPPHALAALGKAALSVCSMLCGAAASFFYSSPEAAEHGAANMPKYAQTVLEHPAMISAMVAAVSAGLYGELLLDLIAAAKAQASADTNSSSRNSLGPLTVSVQELQAAVDVSDDLPAAAWKIVSAQEGHLQAGQGLLPALQQQQLLESLGCSSKGFLWLAGHWCSEPVGGLAGDLKVQQLLMIALQVHFVVELAHLNSAGSKQQVPPHVLQQLTLMPGLLLRFALHQQHTSAAAAAPSTWNPMLGARLGMESVLLWTRLCEKTIAQQAKGPKQKQAGSQPVGELPAAVLHDVLQVLVRMLRSALQQPHSSSSSSSSRASSAWHFPADSAFDARSPAVIVATLAGHIASLIPIITPAVVGPTSKPPSSNSSSSSKIGSSSGRLSKSEPCPDCFSPSRSRSRSRSSSSASLALDWAPLLTDLAAVLQHSMRFEAQHGPSRPDMDERWLGMYRDIPQGPTWVAAHLFTTCADHSVFDVYLPTEGDSVSDLPPRDVRLELLKPMPPKKESPGDRPSLLLWLLDRASAEQQAQVRQRVLGLLGTALKLCRQSETHREVGIVANFYRGCSKTVWAAVQQLQDSEDCTNGAGSSSGGSTAATASSAGSAAGSNSSSSSNSSSMSEGCVYIPWLVLLGRVLTQSHLVLFAARHWAKQGVAEPIRSPQQAEDRTDIVGTVINVLQLADAGLPASLKYTAAMLATDSSKKLPANKPFEGLMEQILVPDTFKMSAQLRQELQEVGQQVMGFCSSAGMETIGTALQNSSWGLAEAHAAVATYLFQAIGSMGMASATTFPGNQSMPAECQPYMMNEWGIATSLAQQAIQGAFKGRSCDMQELLLLGFTVQPKLSDYLTKLGAQGQMLCLLPTASACNNPMCSNLAGSSEGDIVGGQASRCSGCKLAFYCGRVCQKEHWPFHKQVCKAVQAKKAAAA